MFKSGVPMVWREPTEHLDNCYFCPVNINGFNTKLKQHQICHLPVDWLHTSRKYFYQYLLSWRRLMIKPSVHLPLMKTISLCHLIQTVIIFLRAVSPTLTDLVRELYLPKQSTELLASRLPGKKTPLKPDTNVSFCRKRKVKVQKCFRFNVHILYCDDVEGLLNMELLA